MPKRILTTTSISKLKPDPMRRLEIPDAACAGLYLILQPSGARSWALRHRQGGRPQKLTLGSYQDASFGDVNAHPVLGGRLTLMSARKLAADAMAAIERGENPAHTKRAREKNRMPIVIEEFLKRYVYAKGLRSASAVARTFNVDVLPHWQHRFVSDITRRDVIALLDAHVDRGAPVQANRTLAAVRKFFNWCVERDIIQSSPADGVKPPTPETSRDRVLSDEEIAAIWAAATTTPQPFGPLVKLLLLTGQRLSEVAGIRKDEIDKNGALWTIPAARVKNGEEHTVPLSSPAQSLIAMSKPVMGDARFLFSTTGRSPVSGFGKAKMLFDEKLKIPHWTFHDLRRTAASGMARLGHPVHVVEAVLNHKSGKVSGVAAVYNRYDYAIEKKAALDAWSKHVMSLTRGGGCSLRDQVKT